MGSRLLHAVRLLAVSGLALGFGAGACTRSGDDAGGRTTASTTSSASDPCGCDELEPGDPYSLECLCAAESICGGSTTWEALLERAGADCSDGNVASVVLFGAPESCAGFGELTNRDPDYGGVITARFYDEDGSFVGMWHSEDVPNGPCYDEASWRAGESRDCAPCLLCGAEMTWLFEVELPDCAEYGVAAP
jgi:hypothetical protein